MWHDVLVAIGALTVVSIAAGAAYSAIATRAKRRTHTR